MPRTNHVTMTHDQLRQIINLAGQIAILAPARQPRFSVHAYISWTLIHELRDALAAAGIDWRMLRHRMLELAKEGGN